MYKGVRADETTTERVLAQVVKFKYCAFLNNF